VLRDLIEREAKERSSAVKEVEESLGRDLAAIRDKLESEGRQREERIEQIHEEFLGEYERMHSEFRELTEKYAESEGEFYKMLRDVLKKVKSEVGEGRREREEMEESILVLIEKICDKAMEEAGVR
jgi:predicted  nucleic acid-binding Zn-ribbon protein